MSTREIKKEEWQSFFDGLSKKRSLEKKRAEVEVMDLGIGDQLAAKWVPIFGIVYEAKTDTLEIELEGLTHRIHSPKKIYIEEAQLELSSISVTDEKGTQHIIRLRDPLKLPQQ